MLAELKPRQSRLLNALNGRTRVQGAEAGDGFYRITVLGFRAPTAQVLEHRGLVETRYEGHDGTVVARLTEAGRSAAA